MKFVEINRPVELLRDQRGIYGIGISGAYDDSHPCNLILRPDRLDGVLQLDRLGFHDVAVLQRITGGFRKGMFCRSIEERLRREIHHEALRRAGLPWPAPGDFPPPYWSTDPKQQVRNRQIYHGLRLGSLSIINKLIGELIEKAADPVAIKLARRFAFSHRYSIYRAGAQSLRALQLAESFPALALAIYSRVTIAPPTVDFHKQYEKDRKRRRAAADLVERGARLRDVAALMEIPMTLRRATPGAAHLVPYILCQHPELVSAYMPNSLRRLRIWLPAVNYANKKAGPDFAAWTAKHALEIPHTTLDESLSFLSDVGDWVSNEARLDVDPFVPTMSMRTVTKLSAEWHEVAARLNGPQYAFAAPWYPAAKVGGYDILPIDNSVDLYREGSAMHHCVGTYSDRVVSGDAYFYSIRRDAERVATAQLARGEGGGTLAQIRGPCNAKVPKPIVAVVQKWLRSARATNPSLPPPRSSTIDRIAALGGGNGSADKMMSREEETAWLIRIDRLFKALVDDETKLTIDAAELRAEEIIPNKDRVSPAIYKLALDIYQRCADDISQRWIEQLMGRGVSSWPPDAASPDDVPF
jgi:PcfJ-like protein